MHNTPESTAQGTIAIGLRPQPASGGAQLTVDVTLPADDATGSIVSIAAAARSLLQQLGGTLVVADDADRATLLKATIPVTSLVAAPESISQGSDQVMFDPYVEHQRVTPSLRILSVEDQRPNRLMLTAVLERAGHRATMSADPDRALTHIMEDQFDVIILDVRMPVMDGFELAKRLRALDDERRNTPILFLTADLSEETMAGAAEVGALHVLSKPLRAERLLAAIASTRTIARQPDQTETA